MRIRLSIWSIIALNLDAILLLNLDAELDAVSFGKEFQKVPEPDLDEIQEIESASFLSFNETLRQ